MRKLLILTIMLIGVLAPVAVYAKRTSIAVDAVDDLVQIIKFAGTTSTDRPYFEGTVNTYGTFNSCTVHYLISTDDGTTKSAVKDSTGTAVTSTAADNFRFQLGWPSFSNSTILYASVSGCGGAPDVSIDMDSVH